MNKPVIIADALIKKLMDNEEANKLADTRVIHCKKCRQAIKNKIYSVISDKRFPQIQGKMCQLCGCSLSLKIRSLDKCPLKLW